LDEIMMGKQSAGILMYRIEGDTLRVFLVHPGGPYWMKKDQGAWTIPKGEFEAKEEKPLQAAKREFKEETGYTVDGPFIALDSIRQRSGKVVHAWAAEGDCDPEGITSNAFSLEWPPKSGKQQEFPEVDKAGWFSVDETRIKIKPEQYAFVKRLQEILQTIDEGH
jgi:predicted NUDIX family NTP pyrophosphohydrolase